MEVTASCSLPSVLKRAGQGPLQATGRRESCASQHPSPFSLFFPSPLAAPLCFSRLVPQPLFSPSTPHLLSAPLLLPSCPGPGGGCMSPHCPSSRFTEHMLLCPSQALDILGTVCCRAGGSTSDSAVLGGRNQSLETRIDPAGWQREERKEEQLVGSLQCVCGVVGECIWHGSPGWDVLSPEPVGRHLCIPSCPEGAACEPRNGEDDECGQDLCSKAHHPQCLSG